MGGAEDLPEGPILVSACLLGRCCRYDGKVFENTDLVRLQEAGILVPICPEEDGGLPTPRPAAEIKGGTGASVLDGEARVADENGRDVTDAYLRGARAALEAAKQNGARTALLKSRSPSCGVGQTHADGGVAEGDGVTAALLRRHGIQVVPCDPDQD